MPSKLLADRAGELAAAYLRLCEQAGAEVLSESLGLCRELCGLATANDPAVAQAGSDAIFRQIVEHLGDRFEAQLCDVYVRFFSQVVDFCRHLPAGRSLHRKLWELGLENEAQFLDRANRVRRGRRCEPLSTAAIKRVKKVFVLSRVTLGADVAVTSVILSRMKELYRGAEVLLLGGAKAGSLFASDPLITLVPAVYNRGGTLLDRLGAWVSLTEQMARQTEGLAPDEYLIVDPDSRLTQLGLLPLTADDSNYYFFESRSYTSPPTEELAQLTGRWLDEVFGWQSVTTDAWAYRPTMPYVSLSAKDCQLGHEVRQARPGRLAAVNLGVGDNPAKRIADPFELDLLLALLEAGYTVLLDRGAGSEELSRSASLAVALGQAGKSVGSVTTSGIDVAEVMTWDGSLSGFAALIAVSDLYVGYDSAGGHLAAALGVPGIDVFAGAVAPRMIERWRPWGEGEVRVVVTEPGADPDAVLAKVRRAWLEFRG